MKCIKHPDGRLEFNGTPHELLEAIGIGLIAPLPAVPLPAVPLPAPFDPTTDPHAAPGIGCRACAESSGGTCSQHFRKWYPAPFMTTPDGTSVIIYDGTGTDLSPERFTVC